MNLKEQFNGEKLHIHMFYWILILMLIIIALVTNRSYSNQGLSEQVAFGATLSGIILSVIAIIMTLIGESKSDNTKDKLVNLSEDLEKIVVDIKNTTANLEIVLKSNCEMKESIVKMSDSIENIMSFPQTSSLKEKDTYEEMAKYYLEVFKNFISNQKKPFKKHTFLIFVYIHLRCDRNSKLSYENYCDDLISLGFFTEKDDKSLRIFWGIAFVFRNIIKSKNCFTDYLEEYLKENYLENYDEIVNYLANSYICETT